MPAVQTLVPGTVWSIEVAVGDEVQAGQALVIVESMKMEIPIEAEEPGTVAEIHCAQGESVAEGQTLITLS